MKKILVVLPSIVLLWMIFAWSIPEKKTEPLSKAGIEWVKKEAARFVVAIDTLKESLSHIVSADTTSVKRARAELKKCRLQYKRIAFFMEYYFPIEAFTCNGPLKVDVDDEDALDPMGMQQIEAFLYEPDPASHKEEFRKDAEQMSYSMKATLFALNNFYTEDKAFLESIRLELIRTMALYIEGFDAPQLKSGIQEAYESLSSIEVALQPYIKNATQKNSIESCFTQGKNYLKKHPDFDSFDRLFFITSYSLPLEQYLNGLNEPGWTYGASSALNIHAKNLFSPDALNKEAFPHSENLHNSLLSKLGKQLFSDRVFSVNGKRSCATCHNPNKFFNDGLIRNKVLDGSSDLLRNTPTLMYAYFQHFQFWDGHANSLEKQAHAVLTTGHEMNVNKDVVLKKLQSDLSYAAQFKKIWPKEKDPASFPHAISALAAFVQTLRPFNSDFDRYIQGDKNAITNQQKRGFNLFMGKATCGTCHFAPLFNGLIPPTYTSTEFEVLGTPMNDNLEKPVADTDLGRYNILPIEQFKGAFKTSTVRNAAKTAPYMHNGVFATLEKVIEFYDKGGGTGIGLNVPQQTLPNSPLKLTKEEKADIIAFIRSLTDKEVKH
jgi:cytochrome c peroxidase